MKQNISALMDGELFDEDAEEVLNQLKRAPAAHADWQVYHLISDALRQPDHVHSDIGHSMRERLRDEPTVLAPAAQQKIARWYAVSAAASVMALTLVAWLSVQAGSETPAQVATMQNAVYPASFPTANHLDDYLTAHQEFSPSKEVLGMTSHVRSVTRNVDNQPKR